MDSFFLSCVYAKHFSFSSLERNHEGSNKEYGDVAHTGYTVEELCRGLGETGEVDGADGRFASHAVGASQEANGEATCSVGKAGKGIPNAERGTPT